MRLLNLALIAGALFFTGCASKPKSIYYWESGYTDSVYEYLNDEVDINARIIELEDYIHNATSKGAKVPPGLYAHIGLLYSKNGNIGKFYEYLNKEANEFPESIKYIEFLKSKKGGNI